MLLDLQFAHFVPAFAINLAGHDLRGSRQVRPHSLETLGKVLTGPMRLRSVISEGFNKHVLIWVCKAARPLEPQVSFFLARGLREVGLTPLDEASRKQILTELGMPALTDRAITDVGSLLSGLKTIEHDRVIWEH